MFPCSKKCTYRRSKRESVFRTRTLSNMVARDEQRIRISKMAAFRSQILEVITGTDMYFHFPWLFHVGFLFPSEQLQFLWDSALVSVIFYPCFGDVVINKSVTVPYLKCTHRQWNLVRLNALHINNHIYNKSSNEYLKKSTR